MTRLMLSSFTLLSCFFTLVSAANPSHLLAKLPGQPEVRFNQYAGYIAVNSSELFYWFYEADQVNASSLPLALWLNGGPGCSSIGAGAFSEIGPFRVNSSGTGLVLNSHSWNKAANLLFLESPHGTGFSNAGGVNNDDETTSLMSLQFLLEWFKRFPEYTKNDFYLLGESYAGHYVPALAARILEHNRARGGVINLKGFALGNPWTDPYHDNKGDTEFFHSHSIIPDNIFKELMDNCNFSLLRPINSGSDNARCHTAADAVYDLLKGVNRYNIYKPACLTPGTKVIQADTGGPQASLHSEILMKAYSPCDDEVGQYLNLPEVQAALNVSKSWSLCNLDIFEGYRESDILASMLPLYRHLLRANLKIWIYSGDLDGVVSTLSTRHWLRALGLATETPWRAWSYRNRVGGWTETYAGLTFVTVREAGHMVPADRPQEALVVFEHFLNGKPLTLTF